MDSSSSLQGATGTAKTDPSNAYQQQSTKGTFHKRSGLQSTNTQQGNNEYTLLKQSVLDSPLLEDTTVGSLFLVLASLRATSSIFDSCHVGVLFTFQQYKLEDASKIKRAMWKSK